MEHLVVLSASPLERKGGNVGLCGPLKCEKLFCPEDPGDNTSPKFNSSPRKNGDWKDLIFFLGPTTYFLQRRIFCSISGAWYFFFLSADVCWLGVKKTPRKLWCFFRSKSLDEVYNLGSPPPPWLGPCWAMLACWVVKLGSLHRSGPKKRWKFVQEFWEDKKKEPCFVVSDGLKRTLLKVERLEKKNSIEVEVVFKRANPHSFLLVTMPS